MRISSMVLSESGCFIPGFVVVSLMIDARTLRITIITSRSFELSVIGVGPGKWGAGGGRRCS